ncbi:MAG TPA: cadherin-like domain-containing protein [Dongiaceae bacterium]|nr:cadherin-like domain-containing protein [Dongiaceae bacterium]
MAGPLTAGSHSIEITATDNHGLSTAQTFSIDVTSVGNAVPVLVSNDLVVAVGGMDIVQESELETTDSDNAPNQIVYTLTTLPALGILLLSGQALALGGTFTQQDIADGLLRYLQDGAGGGADTFTVSITDGSNTLSSQVISITIAQEGVVADGDTSLGDPLIVGDTAFGRLDVVGGSAVSAGTIIAGNTATGDGNIRLDGTGSTMSAGVGGVTIGNHGMGQLLVEGGATIEAQGSFENLVLGSWSDGFGQAIVSGAGSSIIAKGTDNRIVVGYDGSGNLLIENGGLVSALSIDIGRTAGSTGLVTVTGAGSALIASNDFGLFSDRPESAGFVRVGQAGGSIGELDVMDGGSVEIRPGAATDTQSAQLSIAQDLGSIGNVLVSGTGSNISIFQDPSLVSDPGNSSDLLEGSGIVVGQMGQASMSVTDGATVEVSGNESYIGVGIGNLADTDDTTPLPLSTLSISLGGNVTLTETLAAVSNDSGVYIGDMKNGNGLVTVDGTGSLLSVNGTHSVVVVGRAGNGQLIVSDGGTVAALWLDVGRSGSGAVTIEGAGSKIVASNDSGLFSGSNSVFAGFVRVGGESGSHGALTIIDGGLLEMRPGESINTNTTGAGMNVAQYAGSTGIVSVSGSGSAIVVEGDDNGINIGRGGNGFLSVTGGGQITTQFIQFGRNVGSVGTGVVSGVGSKIDASGFDSGVAVGRYGTGSLTIDDGGFVTTDFVNIGRGGTGVGTILVTGAGSMLVTDGANDGINVGREGQGVLEILDGGQVQTGSVVLAHLGGSGAVIVSGSGSTLQVDGTYGDIIVGRYGQGTFLVQSSGHVEARYFEVGHVGGGVGDVVVSGTGSQLITAGEDNQIGVGREGAGTLIVQEGGLVKTLNLQIGRYGSGAVSIDGAGTQVIVSNDEGLSSEPYAYEAGFVRVTRGDGAVGTLSITNGAHLDIRSGISQNTDTYGAGLAIGYEATSSGHVTVAGAGSRIQITQEIVPAGPHYGYGPFISINGQGSLTVQNLGQVSVTGPYASLDAGGRAGSNVHVVVTNGGSIVVDGKDASINVGQQGTGTLEITGGGSVTTEFMNIANGFGSTGTVLVSGAGSELITAGLDNTIQVGRGGTGALTVENGGLVKALNFVVGRDGTGTATIDGAGSKIVVSSDEGLNAEPYTYESGFVRISRSNGSTGTLNVVNGGELEIRSGIGVNTDTYGAGLAIGRDATSAGHVLVSGEGSLIHITQDVVPPGPLFGSGPYARLNGQAVLTIEDKGQLVIEGPYAAIRVGGREGSNAHMEVLSGGSVLVDNKGYAGGLAIGGGLNTAGSVHVGGAGSSIILAGEGNRLMLGTFGDGSLLIDDGGLVKTVAVDIGYQGSGSITVSGSGSSLIVSNDEGNNSDAAGNISIYSGSKLEVVNGGRVEVRPGVMNPNGLRAGIDFNTVTSSAAGTLRVAGVGSIVLIQQTFVEPGDIGNFAGALLDLHNGAVATIEQSGKLEIDGPGSNLSIGGPGEGRLEVLSGGTVILDGKGSEAGMFVGGGEPNWSGSVVISGSGSSLTVAGGTYAVVHVGYVGESRLTVASGGTLISGISGDSVIDVQIFSNGVLDGGGGTIKGDVYIDNGGQLLAGDGTVTELSIDGNLLMNNSSLSVDASADSLSDRYIVTGQVDIWSAQFEFNFVGGYLPQEGDGFNFMKAAAINVDLNNLQYVLYGISADGIFDFNITNDGNFLYFNSLADTTASDGLIYRGSASHDFFVATTGSDEIHGGAGDDELFGDAGNDFIAGGSGQDKLDGGSGMDSFFYQTPSDGTQTAVNTLSSNVGPGDQISNFDAAVDKFVFNAAAFNLVDISSLNFAVSDAVYDGSVDSLTNGASADYQDGKASFIVDSANHLIYDDNGAADGYTVVATVELAPNSPAITESNLQAA